MARRTVEITTALSASAERVHAHATSMPTINQEMGPWLKMTYPRAAEGMSLADAAPLLGQPLFTSWVLFLGLVPVERMQVRIVELGPGFRFVEESHVTFLRLWRHERVIESRGDEACTVTDRLTLEPRIGVFAAPLAAFVRAFFGHRHRQLFRTFGGATP